MKGGRFSRSRGTPAVFPRDFTAPAPVQNSSCDIKVSDVVACCLARLLVLLEVLQCGCSWVLMLTVTAGVRAEHGDVLCVVGWRRWHCVGEIPCRRVQSLWRCHGDVYRPSFEPCAGVLWWRWARTESCLRDQESTGQGPSSTGLSWYSLLSLYHLD